MQVGMLNFDPDFVIITLSLVTVSFKLIFPFIALVIVLTLLKVR